VLFGASRVPAKVRRNAERENVKSITRKLLVFLMLLNRIASKNKNGKMVNKAICLGQFMGSRKFKATTEHVPYTRNRNFQKLPVEF
jgi:hypothetical protein